MQFIRGQFVRWLFAMVLVSPLFAVLPASAAVVSVEGNHRVDSETISSYFTGTDPAAINKAVKDLYATGLFSDVQIRHEGGRIVIVVTENSVINRVAFEGNSKIKSEQLAADIQSKTHGAYSRTTLDADVQRIRDDYRRAGNAAAAVSYRIVNLPNGTVNVVFEIKEGEKTGIKHIAFVGNHVFSSGKLVDLMQTTEMNWLSWFKLTDVYDPDRIASDLELLRRFYLRNGYADFRVTGSDSRYDATEGGYILTITVEEGVQYRVKSVDIDSHLPDIIADSLRGYVRVSAGETYDGDKVQKTTEAMTKELGHRGYPFSQVHPRGDRDPTTQTVSIVFVIDNGPRVYVERIDIRGNTRTRDYVIRREFDLTEGDAYNKVLIDRAERRLNSLGFFKTVKITNEPGSAADRVIVVVKVEDKATGSFSVSGGYSTAEGFISEVAISEANFMGRGDFTRLAVSYGEYSRGITYSFTEPYFLGQRLAAGFDVYAKENEVNPYSYYQNTMIGGTLRSGLPITDEITFSPRYSAYSSTISIPNNSYLPYNDCWSPIPGITPLNDQFGNAVPGYGGQASFTSNCLSNGEASLALKEAQGTTLTSMPGFTISYNNLDNPKNPSSGIHAELREDVAGLGGDLRYSRTGADFRFYQSIWPVSDQLVGLVHLQGGFLAPWGGDELRVIDNFNNGPSLVRGFAPGGIGPRDISPGIDWSGNSLGGTKYWGASAELQFPIWGIPKEVGLKGALFADAGALWGFTGQTNFAGPNGTACYSCPVTQYNVFPYYTQGNTITVGDDTMQVRSSLGASIIWASPLGPIRFDFAQAITKNQYDQTQFFRFSGGTTF
ncbi:MAG: outer membrane protein assembly factor BamA [Beijerinckiaceae bacterium]